MKKEANKKSKAWIWLVVGIVVVLAVVGVVLALVLGGEADTDEGPKGGRADLYWNVDKAFYTENSASGLSTREPGEDGVYKVRFAYNGELVELPIADKQLINYIDSLDCMGIVQDADGTVIDVVDPTTLATETAKLFYVSKADDSCIYLNSSMAMNGMQAQIQVQDVTQIYDVSKEAEVPGELIKASALEAMDRVTVYSNDLGEATHVYLVSHPVESPVYWRADSGTYSSTTKSTTRVPDADGYYTVPFYVNGEYVELKCNNQNIVSTIDAKNRFKAHTGLVLDENGYIVDNLLAATGIRGMLGCEMYDITEIDGKTFTAEALISGNGSVYTNTLTDDTVIYDVSLAAKPEVRGKAVDSLQIGDRVVVFENTDGEAILVFVAHRLIDSPMYFNVTRKWTSTTRSTTRVPDASGWYYIDLISNGNLKTYKTKDKALVDKIDSFANRSVGLELDGDVITYVWEGECVAGYSALTGYTVTTVTGSIISAYPTSGEENIKNLILHPDCKIYNMSGVRQEKGAETTLQPGDYCVLWRNAKSEIVYAFVLRRPVDATIYFSLTRKWDSTTEQTTRVPDENGYYIYECASEGKQVTVKTKDKKAANFLDSQSPQSFAANVNSDGVIYEYFETTNVTGGNKSYLNTLVKKIGKGEITVYNPSNDKTYTPKLAENCKIYNMSGAVEKFKGEKTTLQLNDNIQCYTNAQGEVVLIYVRIRKVDADIYFSKNRVKEVTAEGKTARQPDADGWYVFECAKDGKEVTVKTKDLEIATFMDAQSPQSFALIVDKDGVVQKAYSTTSATGGSTRALNAVVTSVDGGKIIVKLTTGDDYEMSMASKYEVYNVSSSIDDHFGEVTKIKVGDSLQSYTNSENKVCIVFVKSRGSSVTNDTTPKKIYWNVDRQYDSVNNVSKRTPDANGYYYVDMAVDGEIKTFKTKVQSAINYADSAGGAVALTLTEPGSLEFTKAQSALYVAGVKGAGTAGTVKAIDGNKITLITGVTFTATSSVEVYDVSGNGDFIGQATQLKVGDNYRCYVNEDGEIMYIYVLTRAANTQKLPVYDNSNLVFEEGTTKAKCVYCDKVVEWTALEPISSYFTLVDGGHYYLADSITTNGSYYNIVTNTSACVHLNGNNVTSTTRVFAVGTDGQLNIMGNGVVTGSYTNSATANVAAATISCRGGMNLIGGTYKHTNSNLPTILMSRAQNTLNIYEGATIEGTEGVTGSNVYMMYGILNMYGGTITGGTATPNGTTDGKGGNVYIYGWTGSAGARVELNMYGGTIDGGVYALCTTNSFKVSVSGNSVISEKDGGLTLDTATAAKLTLGELGANAKIYVTGDGVITNESASASEYVNTKVLPASSNITLKAENDVIVATMEQVVEPAEPVWKMAWVVDPQYDATNSVTTRAPDADGYYYVDLSIDGVTETYKTKATGLIVNGVGGIDYVDQSGSKDRAIAVYLTDEGSLEFTNALGATHDTGAIDAKVTTLTAVDGTTVTCEDSTVLKLAADAKIFDVSDKASVEGELTTLKVGDYCRFYTDANGDILYGYVYTRADEPVVEEFDMNTVHELADTMASVFSTDTGAGVEAKCPICQQSVTWTALPAVTTSSLKLASGHYYVAADSEGMSSYYNVDDGVEVCIHLNGKTLDCDDERVFYVDKGSKFNVMGAGNVIGGRKLSAAAERCGSPLEAVGENTVVNLCGGTWSKSRDDLDVIGVRVRGNDGALNIYDGTVINIGDVTGNALWVASGNVNLAGGEINGDVFVRKFSASTSTPYSINLTIADVAINGKVTFDNSMGNEIQTTVQGEAVIAELIPHANLPIYIGRLTAGADIKVTADGAFTAANPNAQNYVDDGFISAKAEGKILTVSVDGVISVVEAPKAYDNSNLVFEEGTTKAMCPWCGEVKEWAAIEPDGNGTQIDLADGGHYYLANDLLNNTSAISSNVANACVHLNGHKIETVGNYAFILQLKKGLTIMGNGEVSSSGTVAATISSAGTLNLVGGTYSCAAETSPVIKHTRSNYAISVYQDVTINGNDGVQGSAINYTYGDFNLYGGTINGNIYIHGNNGTSNVISKVVIDGGIIDGGLQVAHASSTAFLNIAGAPVITAKNGGLNYCNKITIERLTKGAEIYVTAVDGEFTVANDRAADFLEYGYIKAAVEGKNITEKDGVLSIG